MDDVRRIYTDAVANVATDDQHVHTDTHEESFVQCVLKDVLYGSSVTPSSKEGAGLVLIDDKVAIRTVHLHAGSKCVVVMCQVRTYGSTHQMLSGLLGLCCTTTHMLLKYSGLYIDTFVFVVLMDCALRAWVGSPAQH